MAHSPHHCNGHPEHYYIHLQVLAGRIERALQKGLALDELSADKRSLPPDMRWAAMTDIMSGSGWVARCTLTPDMRPACNGKGCWL